MHISLTPMRSDQTLTLSKEGDVLTVNGVAHDFSALKAGETRPRAAPDACGFVADPYRDDTGALYLRLVLPVGPDASDAATHPAPLDITEDGPIPLPA